MRIENNGIYAIRNPDGDLMIKRLFRTDSTLTALSDNHTKYKTYTIALAEYATLDIVIGRVVWVGKELV